MFPGLCIKCKHAKRLVSAKGSEFWFCKRAETDEKFPRYPRLPVTQCRGFEEGAVDSENAPKNAPA